MRMKAFLLISAAILLSFSSGQAADVVMNGSFEMLPTRPERPPFWFEGWSDSPSSYSANGSWALDIMSLTEGHFGLRMSPTSAGGYVLSQILHAPSYSLLGKTVSVSADIRCSGLASPAAVIVLAFNPALPPDPAFGIGCAGKAVLAATGPENAWQTYTGSFTATDNAAGMVLVLYTAGSSGDAWFDNVVVEMDVPSPGPDPVPRMFSLSERGFRLGFVGDFPQDFSEKAEEELIEKTAANAELLNLFFTVRWTSLTGESLTDGHRQKLRMASLGRAFRLPLVLTFNFTHDNADSIGHLVPAPSGNPPPVALPYELTNPLVREAFKDELLALAEIVRPQWVMIGIEMDFFHDNHPDQWDDYAALYKECYYALQTRHKNIRIGTYFTVPWMVSNSGDLNPGNAAEWRRLLPELDFIGYSAYPGPFPGLPADPPAGYFVKAREVAPDLPLVVPEFGIPGGSGAILTEAEQALVLERMFREFSTANVEFVAWYHCFDYHYLGAPAWFEQAFSKIGLHYQDGTPKEAWAAWQAAHDAPNPFHRNTPIRKY